MTPLSTQNWISRVCRAFAAAALAWGFAAGCDDDHPGGPDAGGTAAADTGAEKSDGTRLERERTAYGLPLPPKTRDVQHLPNGTEVTTEMKIDALEEFYETRLVDYEIVRPSPEKIRVIGLRELMPTIRGHRYGPIAVLYYAPSRKKPEGDTGTGAASQADTGTGMEAPSVGASDEQRRSQPEPGSPVRLEADDGEPLAPGARWGEPYTPPEDSPLHKPRYRENFGKPFGEWKLP
jgi:hypothetical protein